MSSFFRPFVDQENVSQLRLGSRPQAAAIGRGPVGKTFQSANITTSQTPARRALGDLNTGNKSALRLEQKVSNNLFSQLKPAAPGSKPLKGKLQEKQQIAPKKPDAKSRSGEVKIIQTTNRVVEDKENMFIGAEEPDTYEDLWPLAERPATYIPQMKAWRNTRYFPVYEDSESDNSLLSISDIDDDTLEPAGSKVPAAKTEEIPWEQLDEEVLRDLELPSLDGLELL